MDDGSCPVVVQLALEVLVVLLEVMVPEEVEARGHHEGDSAGDSGGACGGGDSVVGGRGGNVSCRRSCCWFSWW